MSMIKTIRDQDGFITSSEALQAASCLERLHVALQKLIDASNEAPSMTGTVLHAVTTANIAIEELRL